MRTTTPRMVRSSHLDCVPVPFSTERWPATAPISLFVSKLWDDGDRHVEELIALAADLTTAQSTYNDAVKRRPGKLITLRQKARVIKKSR
jgi:hypothetical protein